MSRNPSGKRRMENASQSREMVRRHENEGMFRKQQVAPHGWNRGPGEGWDRTG